MRRWPLRSDVNRMCFAVLDIQGLSSVNDVLSSLIGASDSNGAPFVGARGLKQVGGSSLRESP